MILLLVILRTLAQASKPLASATRVLKRPRAPSKTHIPNSQSRSQAQEHYKVGMEQPQGSPRRDMESDLQSECFCIVCMERIQNLDFWVEEGVCTRAEAHLTLRHLSIEELRSQALQAFAAARSVGKSRSIRRYHALFLVYCYSHQKYSQWHLPSLSFMARNRWCLRRKRCRPSTVQ